MADVQDARSAPITAGGLAELIIPLGCIAVLWRVPSVGIAILPMGIASFLIERFRPFRRQRIFRTGWSTDIGHAFFTWTYAPAAAIGIITLVMAALGALLGAPLAALHRQNTTLKVVEAIVTADLGAYWFHRWCHTNPLLWRFHRIHHIGEDLDWLSRYRIHPLDVMLLGIVELGPFYLLGVPPLITTVYFLVVGYDGTVSHSNTRLTLGPLWWIIKNPEFHRWHHARDGAVNRNFCELLPIWDVLFGTSHIGRDAPPTRFGVPGNRPTGYIDQVIVPVLSEKRAAALG